MACPLFIAIIQTNVGIYAGGGGELTYLLANWIIINSGNGLSLVPQYQVITWTDCHLDPKEEMLVKF